MLTIQILDRTQSSSEKAIIIHLQINKEKTLVWIIKKYRRNKIGAIWVPSSYKIISLLPFLPFRTSFSKLHERLQGNHNIEHGLNSLRTMQASIHKSIIYFLI